MSIALNKIRVSICFVVSIEYMERLRLKLPVYSVVYTQEVLSVRSESGTMSIGGAELSRETILNAVTPKSELLVSWTRASVSNK